MKSNRSRKWEDISDVDYVQIYRQLKAERSRLLLDIARYTGERWGTLIYLRVEDIFDEKGQPRSWITFRARMTKARFEACCFTRQVPMHPQLKEILEGYQLTRTTGWLFESPFLPGRPITLRAATFMFCRAVDLAGLTYKRFSTHSTRYTFIVRLYEQGVDIYTIQRLTGHNNLNNLVRYIDVDLTHSSKAIASL